MTQQPYPDLMEIRQRLFRTSFNGQNEKAQEFMELAKQAVTERLDQMEEEANAGRFRLYITLYQLNEYEKKLKEYPLLTFTKRFDVDGFGISKRLEGILYSWD